MAKNVKSTVKLNMPVVRRLTAAAQVSLAQTAEAIHTDVVQRKVMPRDTGTLQNESTFVYTQDIANGKVELISSTPYARRLYYHPEYNFQTHENPNAGGEWYKDWLPGGKHADFFERDSHAHVA